MQLSVVRRIRNAFPKVGSLADSSAQNLEGLTLADEESSVQAYKSFGIRRRI